MPIRIPAFVQYQAPLIPLRGVWNRVPPEGDQSINAEIQWGVTTGSTLAVQFALAGNSPVAISQIVALAVDNSRSGADVGFVFPDSGFQLVVPAHEGGIFPVITNALTFYAMAAAAQVGDTTVFQICNSNPPPIPISPTFAQNHAGVSGISVANGTTAVIPAGTSGTINTISLTIELQGAASLESLALSLVDGTGRTVWLGVYNVQASGVLNLQVDLPGLALRFNNGLNAVVSTSNVTSGFITANVYYSTP